VVPARGVGAGARGHGASAVRRALPLHLPGDLRGGAALRAPAWPKLTLDLIPLSSRAELQPRGPRNAALEPLRCACGPKRRVFLLHATIQVPNDAEGLHRAEPPGRSGHVVSLVIKDEARVLAVAEQMVARHIPGLA
jgi:hypothetical protein